MSDYAQAVFEFYKKNLGNTSLDKTTLVGDCPFCPDGFAVPRDYRVGVTCSDNFSVTGQQQGSAHNCENHDESGRDYRSRPPSPAAVDRSPRGRRRWRRAGGRIARPP